MAKIAHKRSSVPSKVPLSTDLVAGELALNTADFAIYFKDSSDNVRAVNDWAQILNKPTGLNAGSVTTVPNTVVLRDANGDIAAANVAVGNDLVITGNLIVNGTTSTVNSTVMIVDDPVMTLSGEVPTSNDARDRGIDFNWHNGSTAKVGFFGFDNSTGKFTFIPDATNTSEVFSGTKGTLDANVEWSDVLSKPSPTISLGGDLSGSVTLSELGSGTLTATINAGSVTLGTDTTGNYVNALTQGSYVLVSGTAGAGWAPTVAVDATPLDLANKVVARDGSGNFAANTITANLTGNVTGDVTGNVTGNAGTATQLQVARNINGVSFDGTQNITITAATPSTLTRGTYLTGSNFNGSAATTWAVDATSANTASKVVARDASGNFSANVITASLTGGNVTNVAISNSTIDNVIVDGGSF